MRIDLDCPAEVWRCQLPQSAEDPCEVTLFNLSDQRIVSAEVTIIFVDSEGAELQRLVERAHDLTGDPGESFVMNLRVPAGMLSKDTHHMEVTVEKVWFSDGIVWRRTRGNLVEYQSNALPRGRERNMLTFIAGQDAIGYPVRQGNLWLCVCGRPNAEETATCARCKRDRDLVFENCSPDAVAKAMERQEERLHQTMQSSTRLGSGENRDFIRRKKNYGRVVVIVAVALLLAAAGAFGYHRWIRPRMEYRAAASLLQSGKYVEAAGAFANLGSYRDSADKTLEARYLRAQELLDQNRFADARAAFADLAERGWQDSADRITETDYLEAVHMLSEGKATEARDAFERLGDYRDSADQVLACKYQLAEQKFNSKKWQEAADAWVELGEYRNSAIRALRARYSLAEEYLAGGAWQEAYDAWIALGEYSDSPARALTALYEAGKAQEDPAAALEWLCREELDGYMDVEELRRKRWYDRGMQLLTAEEPDPYAAGEAFAKAGSYADAEEQAVACLYAPAAELMKEKRYAEAAALFARLPGFRDADAQWVTCIRQQAVAAAAQQDWTGAVAFCDMIPEDAAAIYLRLHYLKADARRCIAGGDYARAMELLRLLPDTDAEVTGMKFECVYLQAKDKEALGEWGSAAVDYEELAGSGYKDSAALALNARYNEAQAYFQSSDYEAAYDVFSSLGDYLNSERRAEESRYRMGIALESTGEYGEAEPIFRELGDYRDAADHLRQVSYSIAVSLLNEGNFAAARERFTALAAEEYADSKTRILACDYAKAEKLQAENNLEAAATSFAELKDYSDARIRASALWYQLAENAEASGDLMRAAQLYSSAGDYKESASRLAAIQDQVYGEFAELARGAIDAGNTAAAASILDALDLTALPERYAFLRELWHDACYAEGKRLLEGGEPDLAYPYLQRCTGHLDTDTLTNREEWNILGTWNDDSAKLILILRKQGKLTVDGVTVPFTFNREKREIRVTLTGDDAQTSEAVYFVLVSVGGGTMELRDMRGEEENLLTLTRKAPDELQPLPAVSFATMTDLPADVAGSVPQTGEAGTEETAAAQTEEPADE